MYFDNCKTEQETKTAYRHLSKILHPDLGGTHEQFIELENEYKKHLKSLSGTYNNSRDEKDGKRQYFYDEAIESDLITMLRALQGLRLPETVDISLQGVWIWIRGTCKDKFGNYPLNARHVQQLENLGCKLHTMKGEMYYRNPKNACHRKDKKTLSFDRIARRFQGSSIPNNGMDQIN